MHGLDFWKSSCVSLVETFSLFVEEHYFSSPSINNIGFSLHQDINMSKSSIHEENSSLEAAGTPDKDHATIKEAERHRDGVETEEQSEPQPHLHAKTFLALFAICLIYFSQTFALVGTGAVSKSP